MKLKVCHVHTLPVNTGVQKFTNLFFEKYHNEFDCSILVSSKGVFTEKNEKLGVKIFTILSLGRSIHPIKDLWTLIQMILLFRKEKFHIVHTHSSKPGIIGRIAARLAGVPVIIHHVHGYAFHEFSSILAKFFYKNLERVAGLFCDLVIFVNEEERILSQNEIVSSKKCITIFNGVITQPKKKQLNKKKIVGFLGRLWEQKDPITMIETFKILAKSNIECWILGDGPLLEEVQQRINQLDEKHRNNIKLFGWLEEPDSKIQFFDVLLVTSLWEGLSFSILEAMSRGIPVVATNIKGNREQIESGKNGFLFPPKNSHLAAHLVLKILNDKKLYDSMSQNSTQKLNAYFSLDVMLESTRTIYIELANRKKVIYSKISNINKNEIIK
ncbi:MAG: glycosyltransferase family 4 protein [Leptospiraceae bacterium]|nr:glycosyltransferase family 4 protein [Leptospiraceae bacterium]